MLVDEARSWIDGERALLGENAAEVWAKALEAPDELTLSERRVIEAYLYSALESWRSTYMLSELGILDSEWQGRVLEETTYIFGNPYGRAWWEVYRESSTRLPKELVNLIDARLQVNPNWTIEYHNDVWQRAIREHQRAEKGKTE